MERATLETLTFERQGHVGRLTLDRPERLNAFTIEMWREMADLGAKLQADPELRALVVIGAGRAFSSGIDTSTFGSGMGIEPTVEAITEGQAAFNWLEDAPYPTIAAIRGHALGAGLQCALACDLRVAERGARLGILELNWGLMPDLGGTQRLPRLVGLGKAKELVFTSATIDAEEAARIGLVERLVDEGELDTHVTSLAEELACRPPIALRGSKQALAVALGADLERGLRLEAKGQVECLTSEDLREAIAARLEGRPPEFRNR